MQQPLVSVIIPVGPRHADHVRTAIASVRWQSVAHLCEIIAVCDGGAQIAPLRDMENLTIVPSDGERRGPAWTRNRAIEQARGEFIVPLDADDYLLPNAIAHLLREYGRGGASYVYGDAYTLEPWGQLPVLHDRTDVTVDTERQHIYVRRSAPDYDQFAMKRHNQHVVTGLFPTRIAREVGGYDEAIDAWEDWTFHLRLAIAGYCGRRLAVPLFVYRVHEGGRMNQFYGGPPELMERVWARYRDDKGEIAMASCCGGDTRLVGIAAEAGQQAPQSSAVNVASGLVRVEYIGPQRGTETLNPRPGRYIRLGNNAMHRYADVSPEEVEWIAERMPIRVLPVHDAPAPPEPAANLHVDDVITPEHDTDAVTVGPLTEVEIETAENVVSKRRKR